jgi:adenylate cyclase class IV
VIELELKALVADPGAVRTALHQVAGAPAFVGMMEDRRFDRDGELTQRGVILRVRRLIGHDGAASEVLTWKGPTTVSEQGYKAREEIEYPIDGSRSAAELLHALGYSVAYRLDRYVEIFHLAGAFVRLEWYPAFDTLVEVEGTGERIEAAIATLPIPRMAFSADPLMRFEERYVARTGRQPRLALQPGEPRPEHWP